MDAILSKSENAKLKCACDAFLSLAEQRWTKFVQENPIQFSERVNRAMSQVSDQLMRTRSWMDSGKKTQGALKDDLRLSLYTKAFKLWKTPLLAQADKAFQEKAETVLKLITPEYLGIDPSLHQNTLFHCAVGKLEELNKFCTPGRVIRVLSECRICINS